ncbi:MAG: DUF4058 family protein [Thermoguttaceae bacterium]|jgi:hypothetical protein|nr:DUF4058 family protein [Thermoguttaceae bacterium]
MPVHDWTRVDAGIFHHFHHGWIAEIARALNRGVLPPGYYALAEQHAAGFGPDVLTLQGIGNNDVDDADEGDAGSAPSPAGGVLLAEPRLRPTAETDMAFYRRKQNLIAVRHVSGDRLIAVVEVVSPGNKAGRNSLRSFVAKAAELLERGIHLLILDLLPPGRRDPQGLHAEIWEEVAGQEYTAPTDKPLTLAAYESGLTIRAYVIPAAVGDVLTDMPLFLEPDKAVDVPLEATYNAAFAEVPQRWRRVLEG